MGSLPFVAVLWIHIFCMSFWMGSAIFGTILGGQPNVQAALERYELTRATAPKLKVVYPVAILLGVLSGITLGTVFGPIRSLSALAGTPYGLTVAAAFVLVVIALLLGPATPPAFMSRWKRFHIGEACLLGAFTCMVLLRAGL